MNNVYLLTGGNLGDRKLNLVQARERIEASIGKVVASSQIYETAAWGITDQQPFLNQALQVQSTLNVHQILCEIPKY